VIRNFRKIIISTIFLMSLFFSIQPIQAATEFICTIKPAGGDYTNLLTWESYVDCELNVSTTMVFSHGGITGSILDGQAVTGVTSGATGTALHVTASQILINNIVGTFQSGEQVYRTQNVNYVILSDAGDSAIAVAECYPMEDTSPLYLNGWGTSASNYIVVRTPASDRHNGVWNDNVFRMSPVNNYCIQSTEANVRIEGLQFYHNYDAANATAITLSGNAADGAQDIRLTNCIFKGKEGGYNYTGVRGIYHSGSHAVGSVVQIWNNIFYDFSNNYSSNSTIALPVGGVNRTIYEYNNTIYNCQTGISRINGDVVLKNNLVQRCTDGYTSGFDASSDNNASDLTGDAPGTNPITGTAIFVSSFNFHLTGGDTFAKDAGANLSLDADLQFTTDIDGHSRPFGSAWDVGADEYEPTDVFPPAAISNLTALSGVNDGEVKLVWTAPGDDGTTYNLNSGFYLIKWSSVNVITGSEFDSPPSSHAVMQINIATATVPGTEHTFVITGLTPGASYYFAIKTRDDDANWSIWVSSKDVSTINLAAYGPSYDAFPSAPTNLLMVSVSSVQANLSWSAVSGSDLDVYKIYCDSWTWPNGTDYKLMGSTSVVYTSCIDYGLKPNTTYMYKITVVDQGPVALESGYSNTVATATRCDIPSTPALLTVYLSSISVSINPVTNPYPTLYAIKVASNNQNISTAGQYVQDNTGTLGASAVWKSTDNWVSSGNVWIGDASLAPNTTHQIAILAKNHSEIISVNYSNLVTTVTLCNQPANVTFGAVYYTSATITWEKTEVPQNPENTIYIVQVSSTSGFITAYTSVTARSLQSAVISGLSINTTYYGRIVVQGWQGINQVTNISGSSSTLSAVPSAPSLLEVYASSISISINTGTNPYPTKYAIKISSRAENITTQGQYVQDNAGALGASAVWKSTDNWASGTNTWVGQSLTPNTSHQIVILSKNWDEVVAVNYANITSTATKCSTPGGAGFGSVYYSSMTITWTKTETPANPEDTIYIVQVSTANNFTTVSFNAAARNAQSVTLESLTVNATYYGRIIARSWYGNDVISNISGSTVTKNATDAPFAPSAVTPTVLGVSSITWNWSDNSSGVYQEQEFRIFTATSSPNVQIATVGQNITTWNQTNLNSNTSYQIYVQAYNTAGSSSSGVSYKYTHAKPPATTVFDSVFITSITISWNANSNPTYTRWGILRSTDNFVSTNTITNFASNYTSTSYPDTNCLTLTTYYYKVQAFNEEGIATLFDITISTKTKPAAPVAPASFTGTAISTNIVEWGWTDISNEEGYRIRRQSDNNILNSVSANTTFWRQAALTANTSATVYVEAYNVTGSSASSSAARYTFANIPLSAVYAGIGYSSVTISWTANSNPSYTRWGILRSADNFVSTTTLTNFTSNYTDTSYIDTTLSIGSTYWYKVQAINEETLVTLCANAGSVITFRPTVTDIPSAPAGISGTAAGASSITWSWTDNSSGLAREDGFKVYTTTSSPNVQVGSVGENITTWTQQGLIPNTSYQIYVQAQNVLGSSNSVTASKYTYANKPSSTTFSGVFITSVTITWNANNNPAYTRWGILRSTDNFASTNALTNYGSNYTDTSYTDATLSANSTYYYKVMAYNEEAAATIAGITISTRTHIMPEFIPPVISSITPTNLLSGVNVAGLVVKVMFNENVDEASALSCISVKAIQNSLGQTIDTALSGTASYDANTHELSFTPSVNAGYNYKYQVDISTIVKDVSGNALALSYSFTFVTISDYQQSNTYISGDGKIKAEIPSGALPVNFYVKIGTDPVNSPDKITPSDITTANGSIDSSEILTGLVYELNIYNTSGERLAGGFGADVYITINYDDVDNDGFVDNVSPPASESTLKIYWLNESDKAWDALAVTDVDTALNTARSKVAHFSVFSLISGKGTTASSDLKEAFAYPVPFEPGLGHTIISFKNLTAAAKIKIYTISGELVTELLEDNGDGIYEWDVKTKENKMLASGVYIYYIYRQDDASDKKTGKFIVIK